jgi:hypothetical protein
MINSQFASHNHKSRVDLLKKVNNRNDTRMLDLIFHAFYTDTIWMFLCEQNHLIGGLFHHQLLLVCEHLHLFIVDTAYPHLLFLLERIQVIVDNIYHHLVFHLAIFRKVQLSIEHVLGEPFIYYNGILVIIFGTVVLLVLFSRALVGVAKNIGIAMFKFKCADSQLLNQVETSERAAIVLQSAWRRKQAQTNLLHSLVDITMAQSVARRYLSKDEVQGRRRARLVESLQIRARFDNEFLPTFGDMWRGIASAEDDDVTSTTEEEYDTNSSPVSSVAESDAPEPNHRLIRKELKERRVAARRNAQRFGIRDKARVDAAKQEKYAAGGGLISSREEEKADCFSDLSEEEDFLALMKDLRATKTIRMSTLFRGLAEALADAECH